MRRSPFSKKKVNDEAEEETNLVVKVIRFPARLEIWLLRPDTSTFFKLNNCISNERQQEI